MILITIFSCNKENDLPFSKKMLNINIGNKILDLNTEQGLEDYIRLVIEEPKAEIVSAELNKLEAEFEDRYLIQSKYKINDFIHSLAIGLEEVFYEATLTSQVSLQATCQMKCTPNSYCSKCRHAIIEWCVSQTCDCREGTGPAGCTGSINFGSEQ